MLYTLLTFFKLSLKITLHDLPYTEFSDVVYPLNDQVKSLRHYQDIPSTFLSSSRYPFCIFVIILDDQELQKSINNSCTSSPLIITIRVTTVRVTASWAILLIK